MADEAKIQKALTKKFITGIALIIFSLILGKLVLLPIIFFPTSNEWRNAMIITYAISWIILLGGLYLTGKEGYALAKYKYKEYSKMTLATMERHGRSAAHRTVKVLRSPIKESRETINRFRNR
jgi:hypothetical protein